MIRPEWYFAPEEYGQVTMSETKQSDEIMSDAEIMQEVREHMAKAEQCISQMVRRGWEVSLRLCESSIDPNDAYYLTFSKPRSRFSVEAKKQSIEKL